MWLCSTVPRQSDLKVYHPQEHESNCLFLYNVKVTNPVRSRIAAPAIVYAVLWDVPLKPHMPLE